jgi:hypothetical protein
VTVPCGTTSVPYLVNIAPAMTASSAYTLTFQSAGAGIVTFSANNWRNFYHVQTGANCGTCALVLPSVPSGFLTGVQLTADVAAEDCPSGGVTITGFTLQVGPAHTIREDTH